MRKECILHKNHFTEDSNATFVCKYQNLEKIPIFERKIYTNSTLKSEYILNDKIIFIEKGTILIQIAEFPEIILEQDLIFFIPTGYNIQFKALSDTEIIEIKILTSVDFCDCHTIQSLINENDIKAPYVPTPIKCNVNLTSYWETIKRYVDEDFRCPGFTQLKINELFFLLSYNYPRKKLFSFFQLSISPDMQFSHMVYKLHTQVKNVSELADLMNYSLSGFQKRFKKIFGIAPSTWLTTQKARRVYNDLAKNVPIKSICEEYNFSSFAHLNQFCQRFFGQGPKQIRQNCGV